MQKVQEFILSQGDLELKMAQIEKKVENFMKMIFRAFHAYDFELLLYKKFCDYPLLTLSHFFLKLQNAQEKFRKFFQKSQN